MTHTSNKKQYLTSHNNMLLITILSIITSLISAFLMVLLGAIVYWRKDTRTSVSSPKLKEIKLKPFVSWVGGKARYLAHIQPLLPTEYDTFIEPFVGGGALFLSLKPNSIIINDINKELITSYEVIRDDPSSLIKLLKEYGSNHNKTFFDTLKEQALPDSPVGIAGRFIYLNKACYAGIYRINREGTFLGSWGHKDKIHLPSDDLILSISSYLNSVDCRILNGDYQQILPLIKPNDFLFVDPPYDGATASFYTAERFSQDNQSELLTFLTEAENKGAKWLVSHHATEFILSLFGKYSPTIVEIPSFNRGIGAKRTDVLIKNY